MIALLQPHSCSLTRRGYETSSGEGPGSFLHRDHFDLSITTSTSRNAAVCSCYSLSQVAKEFGLARIWVGFHFRMATRQGLTQGKQLGGFAFKHYLRPVRHDRDENDEEDEDRD